jgi:hypothetical protein
LDSGYGLVMVDEEGDPEPGDETLSQTADAAQVRAYARLDAAAADWSAMGCAALVLVLLIVLLVWGYVATR